MEKVRKVGLTCLTLVGVFVINIFLSRAFNASLASFLIYCIFCLLMGRLAGTIIHQIWSVDED